MQELGHWFSREWSLDITLDSFPSIVERLRGTPARLEARIGALPPELLRTELEPSWSIQKNAGHLLDLEPVWIGRVEDILEGKEQLREAVRENEESYRAKHHDRPLASILDDEKRHRARLVERMESFDERQLLSSSLHPRLKKPMRLIDFAHFVAEHDDHHFVQISRILRRLGAQ
jgi:uncharacterized damage-inducible protein DinB